jgi:uncharacterized protein (TIGR02246 family)
MTHVLTSWLRASRVGKLSRRALIQSVALVAGGASAAGGQRPAGGSGRKPTPEEYTAIRQVAERYVDAVNRMDAKAWGETFAPDGEWHLGTRGFQGRDQVVTAWSGMMKGIPNVYMHVYSGVVDEVNGDTASGRWYMGEYLNLANGTQTMNQICYSDTYVRLNGQWFIKTRRHATMYRGKPDLSGEFVKLTI